VAARSRSSWARRRCSASSATVLELGGLACVALLGEPAFEFGALGARLLLDAVGALRALLGLLATPL
jgi:hypothetical protein